MEHLDIPVQLQLAKHNKQAQKSLLSVAKFLDGAYIPSEQDADVKYTSMFIILKEVGNTKNVGGRVKKKDCKSDAMHLARDETTRDKYILNMIQHDESNRETLTEMVAIVTNNQKRSRSNHKTTAAALPMLHQEIRAYVVLTPAR